MRQCDHAAHPVEWPEMPLCEDVETVALKRKNTNPVHLNTRSDGEGLAPVSPGATFIHGDPEGQRLSKWPGG